MLRLRERTSLVTLMLKEGTVELAEELYVYYERLASLVHYACVDHDVQCIRRVSRHLVASKAGWYCASAYAEKDAISP